MDFARNYPGESLGHLWRTRQWDYLLSLIDHLPRSSFFAEAAADDEESVQAWIEANPDLADDQKPDLGPRLSELTPEREVLDTIEFRLRELQALVVAVAPGGKYRRQKPPVRRKYAYERLMMQRRSAEHRRNVARLLPGAGVNN